MDGGTGDALLEIEQLLERRFPDLKCLRCGSERFAVIANPEPAPAGVTVPRLAKYGQLAFERVAIATAKGFGRPEHFAKMICKKCGFAEDHYLPAIAIQDMDAASNDRA